jgi:hypothetical protein
MTSQMFGGIKGTIKRCTDKMFGGLSVIEQLVNFLSSKGNSAEKHYSSDPDHDHKGICLFIVVLLI